MRNLQNEFLKKTIVSLTSIRLDFENKRPISGSDEALQQYFRLLHTIKGTSKTFHFNNLSNLAHEVESYLQVVQNEPAKQNTGSLAVLLKSVDQLILQVNADLENVNIPFPVEFISQLRDKIPNFHEAFDPLILCNVSESILKKIDEQEKQFLREAIISGQRIFLAKKTFNSANLFGELAKAKTSIEPNIKMMAMIPVETANDFQTTFQFLLATKLQNSEFSAVLSRCDFEFEKSENLDDFGNLKLMLNSLALQCKENAEILSKKVEILTNCEITDPTFEKTTVICKIVSHLLNNAIAHGIESADERIARDKQPTGRIVLTVSIIDGMIHLTIEDDGDGLDVAKISLASQNKGFIYEIDDKNLTKLLDVVCTQGISTSETLTRISGRGVGLNAVKHLVEAENGSIELATEIGFGATFKIVLPQ